MMSSSRFGIFTFSLGTALLLSSFAVGQTTFDTTGGSGGGDGTTWNDAANWSAGIPSGGVNAIIGDGATVTLASTQAVNELDLVGDQSSSATAVLNHSTGTLTQSGGWMKIGQNAGNNGTYNLSGDAVMNNGGTLYLANGGGTGAINLSGDSAFNGGGVNAGLASGASASISIADNAVFTATDFSLTNGSVDQTGGQLTASSWLAIGKDQGSAAYNISGGTVNATADYFTVGENVAGELNVSGSATVNASDLGLLVGRNDGGVGALEITGSAASINVSDLRVGLDSDGNDTTGTGTLSWIADASGVTTIVSTDNTQLGSDDSALMLDLTADPLSSIAGTEYVLIDNGAAVVGEFAGLSEGANVDLGGGNSGVLSYFGGADGNDVVVTVTASIPEPSSIALLSLLSLSLARRRRKA